MLRNIETFSPEEAAIQAKSKEMKLRQNLNAVWFCAVAAAFFAFWSFFFYIAHHRRQQADWMLIAMMCSVPLLFAGLSVLFWIFVSRDRKELEQLKAVLAARPGAAHPGIWPLPPSVPGP